MIFLYVLLTVYIFAVNFAAFMLVKHQREEWVEGADAPRRSDGTIMLAAVLGGALAVYITMFCLRYRLSNLLLMILMPVLAALNCYCFYLGFRGIYYFW